MGDPETTGRITFQHYRCDDCGAGAVAKEGQQPSACMHPRNIIRHRRGRF